MQLTEFKRGYIGLRNGGLSYLEIAACIGQNASTIMCTWRLWTEDVSMHCCEGSGAHMAASEREDAQLPCMAVTNHATTPTTLGQQWRMVAHQAMSASNVHQ